MTPIPVQDRIFEWLGDPESLVDRFRVHVAKDHWRGMPDGVTPGTTTYAQLVTKCELLSTPFLNEGTVKNYIFTGVSDSPQPGWFEFYFAKSSTTTATDGKVYQSDAPLPPTKFLSAAITTNTRQIVPYGTTPTTGGNVLKSEVVPLDGVRSRLNTDAVLSYTGAPLYSWVLDEETGKGYQVIEQLVSAGTPGSEEVAADGTFAEVQPINTQWSVMTTRKAVTLPTASNPRTWTKTERSPVLFPAVLLAWDLKYVLDTAAQIYLKLFYHTLQPAYSGDVQVNYREWWQKSEPAALASTEMLPTTINIPRIWSPSINVESCLHSEIRVSEPLYVRPGLTDYPEADEVTYVVPATNFTSWPAEVKKLDVDPYRGGFRCLQRAIARPVTSAAGVRVETTAWTPVSGTGYEAYP